jgi:L-lactate dehydrogenase complex protein LldG
LRQSIEECAARFHVEATALGVECYIEHSPGDVRARLAALVDRRRVLSWDSEHLPYEAGQMLDRAIHGNAPREEQATAEVGITACDGAVAETGSLAIFSGPGRSRAVSLLPPCHVALVERRQLCFSMGEFFAVHRDALQASASCTFITGPSRTADIELTLTLGIHGPGRVAIIIGP